MAYPDTEGFAYEWEGTEVTLDGVTYAAVANFTLEQATTREGIKGTRRFILKQTKGSLDGLGEGTVEWTDLEEYNAFLARLDAKGPRREVPFTATGVFVADGYPSQRKTAYGCLLTNEPMSNEPGLGGEMTFTFMYFTINGKPPHSGMPAPTR